MFRPVNCHSPPAAVFPGLVPSRPPYYENGHNRSAPSLCKVGMVWAAPLTAVNGCLWVKVR